MGVNTGLARVTVRESGKDTTKEWIGTNPSINDIALPGESIFRYMDARLAFAYPIDAVFRAFSEISVQEFFSRQISIDIVPTPKGYYSMEIQSNLETSQKIFSKARFHTAAVDGFPFLVSEDDEFLRFPLGATPSTDAVFRAPALEKIAVSAMMESLWGMNMVDYELVHDVFPDTLNRLFFNSYGKSLVSLYQDIPDFQDAYETFHGVQGTQSSRDAGLYPLSGESNGLAKDSILWHNGYRFSWESPS